jgi:voltage-dependent calcium channel T type alpha-1H
MIIGFFFFLNLFIGVVVTTFNNEHDRLGGNDLLTEKQREWIDLKLLILRAAPIKKMSAVENCLGKACFKVVQHPWFEKFIQASIITNSICLLLKWYQQPVEMIQALEIVNYIFTIIFLIEAMLKLLAWGFK